MTDLARLSELKSVDPAELSREELEELATLIRATQPVQPAVVQPIKEEQLQAVDPAKTPPMTATKAWAGGGGAALGAAVAEILVLLLPRLEPAEIALSIVLSTLVAGAATYWAPANRIVR